MKPVLIYWVWEGFLAVVLFYLSAIGLRSALALVVRKKLPFKLGIAAAYAVYIAIAWASYCNAIPLSTVFFWMGLAVLGGIGLKCVTYVQNKKGIFTVDSIVDSLKPVLGFFIIFIVLAALYSMWVVDVRLPVVITGNNDIWFYAKLTHLMLNQPVGNNILNADLLKTPSLSAGLVPTSPIFLAGLAYFLRQEVVDILSVGLILISTMSAVIIKELCIKHWNMRPSLAYLIAVAWASSSFSFYLSGKYYFAQCSGVCLFLAAIWVVLSDEETVLIRATTISLLNYLMFMTYPALFFPYMGILLFLASMKAAFSWKSSGVVFFNPDLISIIFSIPVSLGFACMLDLGHFKTTMALMMGFSNAPQGWPLNLLNPLALMAFPVESIDSGIMAFKIIGYCFILGLVSYITQRAYRKKTLSSARFAVSVVFISGLLAYLCYYWLKGPSYQQWKFAGSVVLPLSFLPMAAVVSAFDGKGRVSAIVKHAFFIVLIVLNVRVMHELEVRFPVDMRMYAPLRALTHYDKAPNVKIINVDFKNDFTGTMIAALFINQKPLSLWSRSYYSKDKVENYAGLSRDRLLITNNCSVFDSQNLTMLGKSFCIINNVPLLAEDYFIKFNGSLPPMLRTAGLSGQEGWGRWSDGHKVVLDIPVKMEWQGAELKIHGVPCILPGAAASQRMSFFVHGRKINELAVASESEIAITLNRDMFNDDHVELTIKLPDAVSPSKFGYTDPRVLGFGFYSLEVRATERP